MFKTFWKYDFRNQRQTLYRMMCQFTFFEFRPEMVPENQSENRSYIQEIFYFKNCSLRLSSVRKEPRVRSKTYWARLSNLTTLNTPATTWTGEWLSNQNRWQWVCYQSSTGRVTQKRRGCFRVQFSGEKLVQLQNWSRELWSGFHCISTNIYGNFSSYLL